jgi:ABC-type cobalamin/Fe3+-siderophores transport system ATPase subunit
VIRRLYVHNFRCLENFELKIEGMPSVLLIGKNGSGKTAVGLALEILQKIGRGTSQVRDLTVAKDFSRGRSDVPMRFEIEVKLGAEIYVYSIAFELPRDGKELRVFDEKLEVDGDSVYLRREEQVRLVMWHTESELIRDSAQGGFPIDRGLVALPIMRQRAGKDDPLGVFKRWLARAVVLRPIPDLMLGDSEGETLEPHPSCTNFAEWFSGVLNPTPAAYSKIDEYLKQVMPDFQQIFWRNEGLFLRFSNEHASMTVTFEDLSSGEKCFMISALLLAANEAYGPLLCFWDEPDNYLALDEVGHFVMALRSEFQKNGGQFIATSHNPEAIRRFSDENTLVLQRRNHLEPTVVRKLADLQVHGDLIGALIRGDLDEPVHGRQSS